ncbi:hypothetical protein PS037_23595 (plasmid) [Escherichia albertii]|uniref:hypothetical protein n=1 Tax=Escherichia albertii TaxID=208962 RepID=UPI0023604CEA|nr:hypothetical protein [Escherichia albertii]WDB54703.1 hypothetical protein PS037_23595 [Escherichia albertii]
MTKPDGYQDSLITSQHTVIDNDKISLVDSVTGRIFISKQDYTFDIINGGVYEVNFLASSEKAGGVNTSGLINVEGKGSLLDVKNWLQADKIKISDLGKVTVENEQQSTSIDDLLVDNGALDTAGYLYISNVGTSENLKVINSGSINAKEISTIFSFSPKHSTKLLVSGAGSEVRADKITIGSQTVSNLSNTLILENKGKVVADKLILQGGDVVIGAHDNTPLSSGIFDVSDVEINDTDWNTNRDSSITLNHNDVILP